jgi:predicted ester cyclase
VGHVPREGGDIKGLACLKPECVSLHFKIEGQIAEEDMVVTPWTLTGTHEGEFMGVAATGKEFSIPGVSVTRLAGGKLIENWGYWGRLSAFQQLGVIRL